jgi:VWFA-related protein
VRLRPALKALLEQVSERSGTLMLVAPGSKVSAVGQLPRDGPALAMAVDRIVGRRVQEHSDMPVADAEAIAIADGDLTTLARVSGRFKALNALLTDDQANMLARERGIDVAYEARRRREEIYAATLLSLDWLGIRPGRHSLIIVSGGFAHDLKDRTFDQIITRSLRVNAPIHFLDARGLQPMGAYQGVEYRQQLGRAVDEGPFGWQEAAAGATALADDTGGVVVANSNDMARGLNRMLDAMTTYYVLAYDPPPHNKSGFRKVQVEVKTKGLQVRARNGYFSDATAPR